MRISIREGSLANWLCFMFGSVENHVVVGQLMEEKKEAAQLSNGHSPWSGDADANQPGGNYSLGGVLTVIQVSLYYIKLSLFIHLNLIFHYSFHQCYRSP